MLWKDTDDTFGYFAYSTCPVASHNRTSCHKLWDRPLQEPQGAPHDLGPHTCSDLLTGLCSDWVLLQCPKSYWLYTNGTLCPFYPSSPTAPHQLRMEMGMWVPVLFMVFRVIEKTLEWPLTSKNSSLRSLTSQTSCYFSVANKNHLELDWRG